MSLSDYQPERVEIKLKKSVFTVKALSLEALAGLIKHHLTDMDTVFDIFKGQGENGEITPEIAKNVALTLAKDLPDLAAALVASATEEGNTPDNLAGAKRLPFPVTVDVLQKIGALTFEEVGGVKKALETLSGLLGLLKKPEKAA